jgi:hypothetical protein
MHIRTNAAILNGQSTCSDKVTHAMPGYHIKSSGIWNAA